MKKRRKTHRKRPPVPRGSSNIGVMILSIALCLGLSLNRWPILSLNGIGPSWLVIWLVVWSIDRTALQGVVAGICHGLLLDGLTAPWPSHALGLGLVGLASVLLYARRFWKSDLLVTPLVVMVMVALNEGVLLLQFAGVEGRSLPHLWAQQQQLFWVAPVLSGVLTPAVYWPLRQWASYRSQIRLQNR